MRLILRWLASFTVTGQLTLLSACNTVDIKDETVYALKPPGLGALEAHTLSTPVRDLSQAEWDVMAAGMLCMSIDAFGDYKKLVQDLCSFNPTQCNYPKVQAGITHLEKLQVKARKAKK